MISIQNLAQTFTSETLLVFKKFNRNILCRVFLFLSFFQEWRRILLHWLFWECPFVQCFKTSFGELICKDIQAELDMPSILLDGDWCGKTDSFNLVILIAKLFIFKSKWQSGKSKDRKKYSTIMSDRKEKHDGKWLSILKAVDSLSLSPSLSLSLSLFLSCPVPISYQTINLFMPGYILMFNAVLWCLIRYLHLNVLYSNIVYYYHYYYHYDDDDDYYHHHHHHYYCYYYYYYYFPCSELCFVSKPGGDIGLDV